MDSPSHYLSWDFIVRLLAIYVEYWREKRNLFPNLYKLAVSFPCTPALSVRCEMIVSKAGEIISKKLNRLKPSTVEKLVLLNKDKLTVIHFVRVLASQTSLISLFNSKLHTPKPWFHYNYITFNVHLMTQ